MSLTLPLVKPGERATVAGRTGSGKSTLACWLLERSPGHWLILNPKHTAAYDKLPDANKVSGFDFKKLERSLSEHRFTVLNPKAEQCTPEVMDEFVGWLHLAYSNIGLCCDELYTMHTNGRAGPGLLGWLTRGRELKQSFIGQTQRPMFVSNFVFTEADQIIGMTLLTAQDRKRMVDNTGRVEFAERMEPHYWLHFDAKKDVLRKFGPVPLK